MLEDKNGRQENRTRNKRLGAEEAREHCFHSEVSREKRQSQKCVFRLKAVYEIELKYHGEKRKKNRKNFKTPNKYWILTHVGFQ
jgi:hypothetical protein